MDAPLPRSEDFETLHPYAGTAWARPLPGLGLWLLYAFDETTVWVEDVRTVEPIRLGE
jgi:hypothetical protein